MVGFLGRHGASGNLLLGQATKKNEQNFVTARFEASHKLLLQEYDKRLPLTGNGTVIPDIAGCKTVSN